MTNAGSLRNKSFLTDNLPALLIFLWMPVYGFIVVCRCRLPLVEGVTYLFHCVDFSMGFCSKFLPGAVYNLFVGEPSVVSATVYEYIRLFIFFAVLAFLLQKWLRKLPREYYGTGIRLLTLYLTGTCSFAAFIYQPGMLDVSWIYLSVVFILCLQNKYTRFLLPLLAVPAVMIHFGVVLCYIPFWALLLLYETISAEDKKEKKILTVLFFATCALALATFIYFAAFEKKNVVYDIYTFNDIITERGADDLRYFDYALYLTPENMDSYLDITGLDWQREAPYLFANTGSKILDPVFVLINQVITHLYAYKNSDFSRVFIEAGASVLLTLPLLGLLFGFIRRKKKQFGSRFGSFFCFCMTAMIPFSLFGSFLISTDSVRWFIHGVLCCFTLVLYIIYKENGVPLAYFRERFQKIQPAFFTIWQLIYAVFIFSAYV